MNLHDLLGRLRTIGDPTWGYVRAARSSNPHLFTVPVHITETGDIWRPQYTPATGRRAVCGYRPRADITGYIITTGATPNDASCNACLSAWDNLSQPQRMNAAYNQRLLTYDDTWHDRIAAEYP